MTSNSYKGNGGDYDDSSSFRLLVLGGYGNVGQPLVRYLLKYGPPQVHIVVAGRNESKAKAFVNKLNHLEECETNKDEPSSHETTSGASTTAEEHADQQLLGRISTRVVDASSSDSLVEALQEEQIDMILVASSTAKYTQTVVEAVLQVPNVDYYDVLYSKDKFEYLQSKAPEIQRAGRCFVTDGGFHPGLPAALIRAAVDLQEKSSHQAEHKNDTGEHTPAPITSIDSILVGGVIKPDWNCLVSEIGAETMEEFAGEFANMLPMEYYDGQWHTQSTWKMMTTIPRQMDFGEPFGSQYVIPMFLEELRDLPRSLNSGVSASTHLGFYIASMNWAVDYVIVPILMAALRVVPPTCLKVRRWLGRLLYWGMQTFSSPPYGNQVMVHIKGHVSSCTTNEKNAPTASSSTSSSSETTTPLLSNKTIQETVLSVKHTDAYLLTVIPVVATLLQYLDSTTTTNSRGADPGVERSGRGGFRKVGVWCQGNLVEPSRFLRDLEHMGVQVETSVKAHHAQPAD